VGVPSGVLVAGEWAGDDLDTWRRAAAAVVATRGRGGEMGEGEEAGVPCSVGPFLYQKGWLCRLEERGPEISRFDDAQFICTFRILTGASKSNSSSSLIDFLNQQLK
jgi:hypothetical protein